MRDLNVALLQRSLLWEEAEQNRQQWQRALAELQGPLDLAVLPEMFTTGFSMNAAAMAEAEDGPTLHWMREQAGQLDCAMTGSIAARVGDGVRNRMLFVSPEQDWQYDKRHLFRMAGEHKRYAPGDRRVIVPWRGWRVCLQVCYDLRFPVWSRNREDYDLLIYVANWPAARRLHWRSLLLARAIENQAYVLGVNRVGDDANGIAYDGDSMAIGPDGSVLADLAGQEKTAQVTLSGSDLLTYRKRFPVHEDADSFSLG